MFKETNKEECNANLCIVFFVQIRSKGSNGCGVLGWVYFELKLTCAKFNFTKMAHSPAE